MKNWVFAIGLAVWGGLAASATNTWYVAKNDSNAADTAVDGRGSEALPFRTIQAALDNESFAPGDIVLVKPGDYDEGTFCPSGSNQQTNRVYVSQTAFIRSTEGRDKTSIVGKWGTGNATNGRGTDGIRCVMVTDAARGTVIEGFTLLNGAAFATDGNNPKYNNHQGGGLLVAGQAKDVYAVDCKFKNCTSDYGGGIYGGTAIRCIFDKCRNYRESSVLYGTYAFACAATRCTHSSETVRYALDAGSVAVNCTFVGNTCRGMTTDAGVAYNCLFGSCTTPTVMAGSSTNDCVVTENTKYVFNNKVHVFSTADDDYRLLSDSEAVGVGNAAHRQVLIDLGVPAKYLDRDLRGDAIDWTAETMNVGAVQQTVAPLSGTVRFTVDTYVDDRLVEANEWICAEGFPASHSIRPADTTESLLYWSRTAQGSSTCNVRPSIVYPRLDGTCWMTLPKRTLENAAFQDYTPVTAAAEIWVDAENGSDTAGTGTDASPYKTLQFAADQVTKTKTLIRAKPGDYDEGGSEYNGLMTRVNLMVFGGHVTGNKNYWNVFLRAEAGPTKTTIWGAADTTDAADDYGNGPNAVRCVCGDNSSAKIQGFTLRDGHTRGASEADVDASAKLGAAVYVYYDKANTMRQEFPLIDCVITNCVSADSIVQYAMTQRCKVMGNTALGALYKRGYHAADLIVGNTCAAILEGDVQIMRSFFLTCVDNKPLAGSDTFANWQGGGDVRVYNSIFVGGDVTTAAHTEYGNVVWELTSAAKLGDTSVVADPLFFNRAAGDYRPGNVSPVADAIDPTDGSDYTEYVTQDLNGQPLRLSSDGKLTAGCLQANLPTAVVVTGADESLLVNGVAGSALTNLQETGSFTLTIAANEQAARLAKGFAVNGVTNLFTSYPGSVTQTLPAGTSGYRMALVPILSTDWYVDAENGDDKKNGFTAALAKRTLADVMTNTVVASGDTVWMRPGTYDAGEMRRSGDSFVLNRVIVPAGVTLKATGTAEETLIVGTAAPEPMDSKGYGLGTNAVRCAFVESGGVLEGVTLTGGRTYGAYYPGSGSSAIDEGVGGGADGAGLVRDCLITNNYAYSGAGGGRVQAVKCRIFDNRAANRGGALFRPLAVYGCVVAGNVGSYTIMYPNSVYNCTFGNNHGQSCVYFYQPDDGDYKVFNSILDRVDKNNNKQIFWHCAINTNTIAISAEKMNFEVTGTFGLAGRDKFLLDDDFKPLAGSPAIDAGDHEKQSPNADGTDLAGTPRVLNGGALDIGAYEYDWRVDYGRILGRRVTVTDVTSNVVAAADGKSVEVPEGSLSATWQTGGKPYSFKTAVTGSGTLTVSRNGETVGTVTAADGERLFRLETAEALTSLDFTFAGEGQAALSQFKRHAGLALIIR